MNSRTKLSAVIVASFMGVLIAGTSVLAHSTKSGTVNSSSNYKKHTREHRLFNKERRGEMLNSKLDKLVNDGTLSQDQADKISAKLRDLKESLRQVNRTNHMEFHKKLKTEFQAWLKANNINVELEQIFPGKKTRHQH